MTGYRYVWTDPDRKKPENCFSSNLLRQPAATASVMPLYILYRVFARCGMCMRPLNAAGAPLAPSAGMELLYLCPCSSVFNGDEDCCVCPVCLGRTGLRCP